MQVSFGYTSILKTHWKNGLMPTVTKGLYGDELTQENVSLEHIKPHSWSGSTIRRCLTEKPKKIFNIQV